MARKNKSKKNEAPHVLVYFIPLAFGTGISGALFWLFAEPVSSLVMFSLGALISCYLFFFIDSAKDCLQPRLPSRYGWKAVQSSVPNKGYEAYAQPIALYPNRSVRRSAYRR